MAKCGTCGGKGKIPFVSGPRFMFHEGPIQPGDEEVIVMVLDPCPECKGEGKGKEPSP